MGAAVVVVGSAGSGEVEDSVGSAGSVGMEEEMVGEVAAAAAGWEVAAAEAAGFGRGGHSIRAEYADDDAPAYQLPPQSLV